MSTVLVFDYDPEIRVVIHDYLSNEGFEVLEAQDGVQALDMLRSNPVQLVVLDVMMPKMDGIKTCVKIRETVPYTWSLLVPAFLVFTVIALRIAKTRDIH